MKKLDLIRHKRLHCEVVNIKLRENRQKQEEIRNTEKREKIRKMKRSQKERISGKAPNLECAKFCLNHL